jgi:DNA polymerase III sliding clamp (beta) subunit (PCNA family)
MQFALSRQDLLSVLKRASAAINASDMLAIRKSVLIIAESSTGGGSPKLTFGATDGPLGIVVTLEACEIKKPGTIVLDHKRLSAIVNELPQGTIEITVGAGYKVSIRSSESKRKFSMTGLDPIDFPSILNEWPGEALYSVEAKILQQAASETGFALSNDMAMGALLSPGDDKLFQLVTLGRYCLAVATGWLTDRASVSKDECLLPKNLLDAVDGLPASSVLTISMDSTKIFVQSSDTLIIAIQLQTQIPPVWPDVLASAPKVRRFRVSSERFLQSVKAVSVAADFVEGAERYVQIDITGTEGNVTVATRRSERSQGEDELEVIDPSPESFKLHIDAGLLSHALRAFLPTEIDFCYDGSGGPLFLRNETLSTMLQLIADIPGPPAKDKK